MSTLSYLGATLTAGLSLHQTTPERGLWAWSQKAGVIGSQGSLEGKVRMRTVPGLWRLGILRHLDSVPVRVQPHRGQSGMPAHGSRTELRVSLATLLIPASGYQGG